MIHSSNLIKRIQRPQCLKLTLIGALVGLALIVSFLSTTGTPNPAWGKYWMIRPLIIVPLAGGAGGACFYLIMSLTSNRFWVKLMAAVLGLLVFLIGLWLGTVLGLDGTYWN